MDLAEFDRIVFEEWMAIPERFKAQLENVALLIEEEPSDPVQKEEGTLLGRYQGIPLTERGSEYGVGMTLPDTITVYRTPIRTRALEEALAMPDAIRLVIRETIWHEVGHYFGFGEEALHEREEEGSNRYTV